MKMIKLLDMYNKWKTRSRSIDGRCKFYDNCEWVAKDAATCLDNDEAEWYCGKYKHNEFQEKFR
jgi:hypothetical protein